MRIGSPRRLPLLGLLPLRLKTSKPVRCGSPTLARFDSAPLRYRICVRSVKRGSRQSGSRLYARRDAPAAGDHPMERTLDPARLGDHLDRLYRAAWALCGSREDAEDLVQETYARLLARPRLLRNEDDLGYLLRALRNTFLNQKRTESRRLRPGPLPDAARPRRRPARASSRRPRSKPASSTRRSPRFRVISATSSWPSTSPASPTRRRHARCASARAR